MSGLPDGYRDKLPEDILVDLVDRLDEQPTGSGHPEGVQPWLCHVVVVASAETTVTTRSATTASTGKGPSTTSSRQHRSP